MKKSSDSQKFKERVIAAIPVGELTLGSDFLILTNIEDGERVDRLAFLDSRGKKVFPEESSKFLASSLAQHWSERGENYLIVTRTHSSTTFFTLINFLHNLRMKIPYLITNVGFVDLTPKKLAVIQDIKEQANIWFDDSLPLIHFEEYELLTGEIETLCALDISQLTNKFRFHLNLYCKQTILLGTYEIPNETMFDRKRPPSFFTQLVETNRLLKKLAKDDASGCINFVSVAIQGEVLESVFDGVHLTEKGHENLFTDLVLNGCI